MFGPFPFEALRLGWLAKGAGPGPKVPTDVILYFYKDSECGTSCISISSFTT